MNNASLIVGIVLFACCISVILAVLRMSRREPAILVVAIPLAVYALGLLGLSATAWRGEIPNFWVVSIVYWFLILSFLMVFGAIYKSLSLRMLLSLLEAEGRAMDDEDLAERYIKQQSFKDRLAVMVDKELATIDQDGRVGLTARGRAVARLARRVQDIYRIEKSG